MAKIKVEIKSRFNGSVLFEYESEDNTIRETVQKAVETGASLRDANLTPIKNDLFIVLLHGLKEISHLKSALVEGRIDGSTYDGECSCLSGTLHSGAIKNDGPQEKDRIKCIMDVRDSNRPIERFFLGINKGDTPENNQAAKIVLEWIDEFEKLIA
jgi:hypothetical protein